MDLNDEDLEEGLEDAETEFEVGMLRLVEADEELDDDLSLGLSKLLMFLPLFPPESLEPELGRILRELDRKLEPEGLEPDSSSLLRPLPRPCLEPRNEEVESIRP